MEDLTTAFSKKFSPQIGNDNTCYDCGINFKELLSFIRQREKVLQKEIDRLVDKK